MTTQLTNRQHFEIGAETYWKELCLNLAYQERLYTEALHCSRMEVLEDTGSYETGVKRRLRFIKRIEAPAAIQKVVGNAVHVDQESEFDARTQRWIYRIIPSVMSDRVDIRGVMHLEPRSGGIDQVTVNTITCRLFGLGGIIEPFVARSTEEGHQDAAAFTKRYLAERGIG